MAHEKCIPKHETSKKENKFTKYLKFDIKAARNYRTEQKLSTIKRSLTKLKFST